MIACPKCGKELRETHNPTIGFCPDCLVQFNLEKLEKDKQEDKQKVKSKESNKTLVIAALALLIYGSISIGIGLSEILTITIHHLILATSIIITISTILIFTTIHIIREGNKKNKKGKKHD